MPKRWSDMVIKELSVLLWGIDALRAWEQRGKSEGFNRDFKIVK